MCNFLNLLLTFSLLIICINSSPVRKKLIFDNRVCDFVDQFNEQLRGHIKNMSTDIQKIINFVVNGKDSGVTYNELSLFVDKFGSRLAGTQNLEDAIDYMVDKLESERHDNVHTEDAPVQQWTRGKEYAQMLTPRQKPVAILGLGSSVGTNGKTLTAEVMVVKTFDELNNRSNEVPGKIVVYNFDFQSYGQQVQYRSTGASEAAKYGAVAALIRSVTPLSIYSPHTGHQTYIYDNVTKIPAVSITVEDAELFHRLVLRGEKVSVRLYMEAENGNTVISRNTISEVKGDKYPEQVVIVSGHLDSWDVGEGAMDDGGGAFISWRALSVIKKLGLIPKRTMRSILWTAEEFGYVGAQAYLNDHINELNSISIAMESDIGTFTPYGLSYSGTNPTAQCIVNEVLQLLKPINATQLVLDNEGSDIMLFIDKGVPGSSLENINDNYFYFHHSNGDSMTVEDTKMLDLCTAVWAATSYAFASLEEILPR